MTIQRGDIVLVAAPGDYGKPRPAIVVQSDFFNPTHASIIVCLISSDLQNAPLFRIDVDPDAGNGLRQKSQIMIDKIISLRRERIANKVGEIDDATLLQVSRALALFLGLADTAS